MDEGKKNCPHCCQYLPLEDFYYRPDRNTCSSWCIVCEKQRSHDQYARKKGAYDKSYWLIPEQVGVFKTPEDKENTRKFLTSIGWKYNNIFRCWTKKGLVEIINGKRKWINIDETQKKTRSHYVKHPEKKELLKSSMCQRTVERPTYEILKKQISELGYTKTGRFYGLSDNTMRKWLRFYEKLYEII